MGGGQIPRPVKNRFDEVYQEDTSYIDQTHDEQQQGEVDETLQFLPGFPAADNLPEPTRRGTDGSFVYAENAWPGAVENSAKKNTRAVKRKRSQEDTQSPANALHAYAAAVDNAEVYMCLYNISHQHFQVFFIDLESGFQSSFLPTEMPVSFRDALHHMQLQ